MFKESLTVIFTINLPANAYRDSITLLSTNVLKEIAQLTETGSDLYLYALNAVFSNRYTVEMLLNECIRG